MIKLQKLYELIINEGIASDPRPKATIDQLMKDRAEAFAALSDRQKKYTDKKTLSNPYDDTRVLFGEPSRPIRTALVGIDIDAGELLTIDRLNAGKKTKIDMAISHHPQGWAYANLDGVMGMQADIFNQCGVPINVAEGLVEERAREINRRIHAANHHRAADIARTLDIPFLCMHTPADNHAVQFLQKLTDRNKPATLGALWELIMSIPEYQTASLEGVPPVILFGKKANRTGKIFIDMTGGTEGPKDIVDHLVQAGVGTVVGMHLSEEHYKKFQGKHVNVLIAGHIASDNLGMNLLCDKIVKASGLRLTACSGFRRHARI